MNRRGAGAGDLRRDARGGDISGGSAVTPQVEYLFRSSNDQLIERSDLDEVIRRS